MIDKNHTYLNVMLALVMAFLLPLAGCFGDPMPQPPTLDYKLITIERNDVTDSVTITGLEGAADTFAHLQFYNFNLSADLFLPYEIDAAGDGSFQVTMPGWKINKYRAVSTAGGVNSTVDFHGNFDGSVTIIDDPIYSCFHISELFIDFGTVPAGNWEFRAVEMTNECESGYDIQITDVYLSDEVNFVVYHSTFPTPVGLDQTEQVGIQFEPAAAGDVLRILEIQFGEFDGDMQVKSYDLKIILKGSGVNP